MSNDLARLWQKVLVNDLTEEFKVRTSNLILVATVCMMLLLGSTALARPGGFSGRFKVVRPASGFSLTQRGGLSLKRSRAPQKRIRLPHGLGRMGKLPKKLPHGIGRIGKLPKKLPHGIGRIGKLPQKLPHGTGPGRQIPVRLPHGLGDLGNIPHRF